jgi:uncharacterized membrane protein YccF (DUF307 family)
MKIIWLVFTFMFFWLAFFHFCQSRKEISRFKNKCQVKAVMGIPLNMEEFINDLNRYIDQVNQSGKVTNLLTGFGYILAAVMAFISFLTVS